MKHIVFIRNLRAPDLFERFLISAISSLLLLRFYLYLTGYPEVGTGNLHIAHMLWGGALMLAAFVLNFAFLGIRIQKIAAITAGVGFGIFIDEIGKFLTKDNNYFFQPSIGIIYAIFAALYLLFSFLGRRQRLSGREYQINALHQLEEAIMDDLDPVERAKVQTLLAQTDSRNQVTKQLSRLLVSVDTVRADKPNILERFFKRFRKMYHRAWRRRGSNAVVRSFFLLESGLFVVAMVATLINNFDELHRLLEGQIDYGQSLVIGQLAATVVASVFVVLGVSSLTVSRRAALELFRRATLVNLLLTEFFVFSRIQFGAMPGFIFNLVLLIILSFSLHEERRQPAKA